VPDAAVAASQAQSRALWRLREALVEAQRFEGGSIKNDVSVPVSRIAVFLDRALAAVAAAVPGIRPVPFGHVGDGNLHLNLSQPVGMDRAAFLDRWEELTLLVGDIACGLGGSISAEHGIGRLKRTELARRKAPVELDLMRRLKAALDPAGIMNPGKIL
jgi:FAD/FMN-containing dehydrogenase